MLFVRPEGGDAEAMERLLRVAREEMELRVTVVGGEDGLVLQSVGPRRAALSTSANGPPSMTIELPLLNKK